MILASITLKILALMFQARITIFPGILHLHGKSISRQGLIFDDKG